jgi:hypothetical protein
MVRCFVRHALRVGLMTLLALGTVAHAEFTTGGGGGGAESDPAVIAALVGEIADARRLEALREAAVRFHDADAARESGYALCGDCLDDTALPGGVRLVEGGSADVVGVTLEEPRFLVYEPRPNGKLRLMGVEYVVPVDAWYDAGFETPPTLFGRSFARTDGVLGEPAYVLFVSVERLLPTGGFAY